MLLEALAALALLGIGAILLLMLRTRAGTGAGSDAGSAVRLEQEMERKTRECGEVKAQLEAEKNERAQLAGKNKQLFAENAKIAAKVEALEKERENLSSRVTRFEAKEEERRKALEKELADLKTTRVTLEQERQRIVQEEQEHRRQAEEERDRMWAEHENTVVALLTSLCKMPQIGFQHYTNTNLPENFDGSLKPDFMIEFIDQYVIFDAKVSKAESLQTYITSTVKKTIEKVKKHPKIATSIFLVVPTKAVSELKSHHYPVDGYNVYVVSPESLLPILMSLKRITSYEFAKSMDPKQRENIVNLIADLDFHINLRNGVDLLLTKLGADLIGKAQSIDTDLADEVAQKKLEKQKKLPNFASAELKKLIADVTLQNLEVQKLASPRASMQSIETLL